jgi:hypothetical protein
VISGEREREVGERDYNLKRVLYSTYNHYPLQRKLKEQGGYSQL